MTSPEHRRVAMLAASPAVHRALAWLHLHELQLRRWQMEFLAIPAPPFGEDPRAAWFCSRFRELGLEDTHIDAEGNALGLTGPSGATPAVLLSAHLDTVFPAETPCHPREDGNRVLCPGACDNGAGLAALLGIAAALRFAGLQPPCRLLFAANVGEEGEGDLRGMRFLLGSPPFGKHIGAVLALEGAGTALTVDRALGSRRLRVTVSGPGGHSWVDARRPNPILALSAALLALRQLSLPAHPRTVLHVGTFHGGTSVNSVPETATAQLDLRSTSETALDELEARVAATLSQALSPWTSPEHGDGGRLHFEAERIGSRPVGELPASHPLHLCLQAVDRHLGLRSDLRIGSTDANLPLSLAVPALALGCGGTGGGLHSTAEWYDPTGRELALRRILLLLLSVCEAVAGGAMPAMDGQPAPVHSTA